jgi:hypothetical protein
VYNKGGAVANSPSLIQKSVSLADFLATAVSDGDQSDVFVTAKTDAAGQEAAATQIAEYGGRLWSNGVDDAFLCTYGMYYKSAKVWGVADATERDALGSDDDLSVNDLLFKQDDTTMWVCTAVTGASTSTWDPIAATGNVAGPGASTDNAVARWDGAGGATLQNSVVIISDLGAISGVTDITLSGTIDGRNVSADGTALDGHIANISNPHSTLLSQALAVGNTTQSNDIEITNGDSIVGEDGGAITFAAGTGVIGLTETAVTGDLSVSGKLSVVGLIDPSGLVLDEQASSPFTAAGKTTIWTKNTVPTTLWYTDDAGNDAQVAPTTSFALASVMAIGNATAGADLLLTDGSQILGEPGAASAGGNVAIQGGAGDGTTNGGGTATVTGGTGAVDGAGGATTIAGGAGGSTSGAGGATLILGGDAQAGNSNGGNLELSSGQASGTGNPGDITITAREALSGNTEGGDVTITCGDGAGTGTGGDFAVTAGGAGVGTATGGTATITAGAGGVSGGIGGMVAVFGGAATAGNGAGGEMAGFGGTGQGSGAGGQAKIQGGDGGATGNGGNGTVRGGAGGATSGTGGNAVVLAGAGTAATATGGAATVTGGAGGSGAATGGAVSITSGAGGGTSGNSGAVNIASGAVTSGTRGTVTIDGGTIVLTATTDITVTNHSYHSVRGSTARGSTNTQIYRWTGAVDNVGTDITYSDSATNGGSWQINTAGIYSVTCSIDTGHNGFIAIKKAAALSNTFDETSIQNAVEAFTGVTVTCSWTGPCSVGDDIWIATSAATNPTGAPINNNRVWVCRVR